MIAYIKYFAVWLLFMGLIAVITLLVPKLSKWIDKKITQIKEQTKDKKAIGDLSDEAIMGNEADKEDAE